MDIRQKLSIVQWMFRLQFQLLLELIRIPLHILKDMRMECTMQVMTVIISYKVMLCSLGIVAIRTIRMRIR